jgi:hypothetical protein
MALSFIKKATVPAPVAQAPTPAPQAPKITLGNAAKAPAPLPPKAGVPVPPAASKAPVPLHKPVIPKPTGATGIGAMLLKRGKEAQAIAEDEEHRQEMRAKSSTRRYYVERAKGKPGNGDVIFLDGDIVDGVLDPASFWEHNLTINGRYGNHFMCIDEINGGNCPLCAAKASHRNFMRALTVINLVPRVSKKDGKTYQNNVELFIMHKDTFALMQKAALKRGGLRGCRFDITRGADKNAPQVGNSFEFVEKYSDQQLAEMFPDKHQPINYADHLEGMYVPEEDLRKVLAQAGLAGGSGGIPQSNKPAFGAEPQDDGDEAEQYAL